MYETKPKQPFCLNFLKELSNTKADMKIGVTYEKSECIYLYSRKKAIRDLWP